MQGQSGAALNMNSKSEVQSLVERYVSSVELALKDLKILDHNSTLIDNNMELVIDAAKRYLSDAKYYLKIKKEAIALTSISYAEGLLDALRIMELVDFEWQRVETS
jgi:FAD synthetase